MARSLSSSRTYLAAAAAATSRSSSSAASSPSSASFRCLALRSNSNLPNNNAEPAVADESTDPLLRKLEDAIHRIIVRRAAPDWLPFLPGTSYWVPPHRSDAGCLGIAQLVEKLANPLTDEESRSVTSVRGWPSSDYFIKGASFGQLPVYNTADELEKDSTSDEVKTEEPSSHAPESETEEG
ncbi:unnamed protein product [Linum tenue]|uniref:Uncharacterized protein n=1 Tax=Linum tenue TaxID=586396 RepID=A0AAV0JL55_9ROSI|nr:unnamed protein product [Linum tenue]CAI0410395.1 unnamed protein product [Linum tenue]